MEIVCHHIGGRDGTGGLSVPSMFSDELKYILYDADSSCIETAKELTKDHSDTVTVLPYCVADENKDVTLSLNNAAATSSIFPYNQSYGEWSRLAPTGQDYFIEQTHGTSEVIEMRGISLAEICANGIQPPHVLTIDAQGAAFEVVLGASPILPSCLAIEAEAELVPLYKGQKLVGDLIDYLTQRGFIFVGLGHTRRMRPLAAPIGMRGKGGEAVCHALFLKSPKHIDMDHDRQNQLIRLAFIAISFKQFEVAFNALKLISQNDISFPEGKIATFIKEMCHLVQTTTWHFPPRATAEELKRSAVKASKRQSVIVHRLKSRGGFLIRSLRGIKKVVNFAIAEINLLLKKSTPVEATLINYGFNEQAEQMKIQRLSDEKIVVK